MATKLQVDLFHKNPQCLEIATIMAGTVYPKIVDLLTRLGMQEVRLGRIEGLKECCFTIDYEIHFFNLGDDKKKKDIYTVKCKNKRVCQYFERESQGVTKEYESPSEIYLKFCKSAVDSICFLEQKLKDIDNTLEILRNINIPITRNVMLEKNKT